MEDFEIELDNNSEIMVDLDNDEQDLFNGVVIFSMVSYDINPLLSNVAQGRWCDS